MFARAKSSVFLARCTFSCTIFTSRAEVPGLILRSVRLAACIRTHVHMSTLSSDALEVFGETVRFEEAVASRKRHLPSQANGESPTSFAHGTLIYNAHAHFL